MRMERGHLARIALLLFLTYGKLSGLFGDLGCRFAGETVVAFMERGHLARIALLLFLTYGKLSACLATMGCRFAGETVVAFMERGHLARIALLLFLTYGKLSACLATWVVDLRARRPRSMFIPLPFRLLENGAALYKPFPRTSSAARRPLPCPTLPRP